MNDKVKETKVKESALTAGPTAALGIQSSSEQQRAIAEVQAAMILARSNPRDQIRALELITQDCARPSLAEKACYVYARGGADVTGPSIRLAECMAQRWGNIQYGVRELEQHENDSLMQAYAWDLEANVKREMIFTVPHVRDTRKGPVALTDSRDVYEITANMGARRLRACILGLIPGDIVEAAVDQVELTLKTKADVTQERVTKMLELFASYGITKEHVEKRIQRRATVETLTPALMLLLGKIANSLRDGMSAPGDWFSDYTAEVPLTNGKPAAVPLVSDVLSVATSYGWTQKTLIEFIRTTFGKELTALDRGDECVAAIAAISEAAEKTEATGDQAPGTAPAPAPEPPSPLSVNDDGEHHAKPTAKVERHRSP